MLTTDYQMLFNVLIGDANGLPIYLRMYAKYTEQDVPNVRSYIVGKTTTYFPNGDNWYSGYYSSSRILIGGIVDNTMSWGGSIRYFYRGETTLQEYGGWAYHDSDGNLNAYFYGDLYPTGWTPSIGAQSDAWRALPSIEVNSKIYCSGSWGSQWGKDRYVYKTTNWGSSWSKVNLYKTTNWGSNWSKIR